MDMDLNKILELLHGGGNVIVIINSNVLIGNCGDTNVENAKSPG